jgi:hypothetical protein
MKTLHMAQRIHLLRIAARSLAGAWVCFAASAARAEILFHHNTPSIFAPINAAADVPFGGSSTISFTGPARVLISFNTECSVGGAATNVLDIDVLLDPAGGAATFSPVSPTGPWDTVLCSGNGTVANTDGRISASIHVVANVPAGTNRVRLRVTPSGGAAGPGRLGARSFTIWR